MIVKTITALVVATSTIAVPTSAPTLQVDEIQTLSKEAELIEFANSVNPRCAKFVPEVMKYDWDTKTVIEILFHESSCIETAKNLKDSHRGCVGSYGVAQVACIHADPQELLTPEKNIEVAYSIYSQSGFRPWGVCTNGKVDCGL